MRQIPTRLNNNGTGSAIIRCGNKPVAEMLAYTSSERDDTAAEFIERWNAFEPDGKVAQLRAEVERLRGELKDIRATVGVTYAVLQSDYEPDPSECDTLLVHAALDMRAAALGKATS